MAIIDRVKVRRLIEQRLALVTGMNWVHAGHVDESAEGVVEGQIIDLRLERQVLNPDDAAMADCSFTVQITVPRSETEQSLYEAEQMVQQIVTLWHTPAQSDVDLTITAYRFTDSVEFGAEEAEGLIVGLVGVMAHVMRSTGSTLEDVGNPG